MKNKMHVITQSCLLFIWACALNLAAEASGDVRLVGGTSHCSGTVEMKHQGKWRPVVGWYEWSQKSSNVVCRQLDCGSAVLTETITDAPIEPVWWLRSESELLCDGSEYKSLTECGVKQSDSSFGRIKVICSESLRLVNGTSLCSGRVEVKSDQSWVSVCEGDLDQKDAEVVCKELGCEAPLVLQGALYGEAKIPMWTKDFQCEGNESVLMDCRTSGSTRNTCSSDKAVGLTCSESDEIRLVGGTSRCTGTLERKYQGEWRPVVDYWWNPRRSAVVCRQLDCGSAVSTEESNGPDASVWTMKSSCVGSESKLSECGTLRHGRSVDRLDVTCSESARLVNGTNLCSGRVEVKSDESWVSVCEGDFDQKDAEVVCRELGCGAPSVLQGALYGEANAPMLNKEFKCKGSESVLLNCGTSESTRNTCSPDRAVGLTCSELDDVRLVGGSSRCNGTLEIKYKGEWRPAATTEYQFNQFADVVCRELHCGRVARKKNRKISTFQSVWYISRACVNSETSLRDCGTRMSTSSFDRHELICSGP